MEGTLWKWTNYWSGWQPRWFILEDGVLSYYKSQDEVCQGCKGSIKMSVCEIIVHPTDTTRLDLVIPSEQHFYVKAATPQERQQWLVSLGTAKANLSAQQKKDSAVTSNPDVLKTKKSELRLYCDLLMQQVHAVKSIATSPDAHPNMETLNEATSLLGPTCDTFIKTLEECMKLANANFTYEIQNHHHNKESTIPSSLPTNNFRKMSKMQVQRSNSADRNNKTSDHSKVARLQNEHSDVIILHHVENGSKRDVILKNNEQKPNFDENVDMVIEQLEVPSAETSNLSDKENDDAEENVAVPRNEVEAKKEIVVQNFFSNIEVSFLNLKLVENDGIPSDHFIKSCAVVLDIFDLFRSPIFTPLRMDVQGNIKKLNSKYQKDPSKFLTLQDIVKYEIDTNTTAVRNSATDALLWLKRGLEFVQEFLMDFTSGYDLSTCVFNAYGKTLKQYHGWIVRNIIMAAAHKVPSRAETLLALALYPEDVRHPLYEKTLMEEARLFIKSMNVLTNVLNEFYYTHKLDKKEVV